MKTFWKVLLFGLLALVCLHLCPILFVPVALSFAAMLIIGVLLTGGLAAVAATGLSLAAGLLAVVLVLLAVLSPIWLPVLALIGLISLCRRGGKTTA
jgi:hypothetical protein